MYTQHVRDDELQLHDEDDDMQLAAYEAQTSAATMRDSGPVQSMLQSAPVQMPLQQVQQSQQPPQQLQQLQQAPLQHWVTSASSRHSPAVSSTAAAATSFSSSPPHVVSVSPQAGLPSPAVVLAPLLHAHQRWLKPAEVQALLLHARASGYRWQARAGGAAATVAATDGGGDGSASVLLPLLSTVPPVRPRPGSLFLYSKTHVLRWRKDGYAWIGGDKHNNLKLHGVDILTCYYAKCAESCPSAAASAGGAATDPAAAAASASPAAEPFLGTAGSFQRRGYCLIRPAGLTPDAASAAVSDIILVHYLDECGAKGGLSVAAMTSQPHSAANQLPPSTASIASSSSATAIDLSQYLPYFFPQCGPVRIPPPVMHANNAAATAAPSASSQSRLQLPGTGTAARPPLLRVISPRRFLAEPQQTQHMRPVPQMQPHQATSASAVAVTLPPTLTVLDYAPASDWMEGGSKMLLVITAAAGAALPSVPLFLHFVRANPSGLPVSVGCSPLERIGAAVTAGAAAGGAEASFRARVPPVAHAGSFYALYVSDAPALNGATSSNGTTPQQQQPQRQATMISTLLPFEYRSRDGTVHDLRTLAPIAKATTTQQPLQSRYRPSPSASPLPFDSPGHTARHMAAASPFLSASPTPLAASSPAMHAANASASSAAASASASAQVAVEHEPSVNLERECIIGLLRRMQSMERAVEQSSSASAASSGLSGDGARVPSSSAALSLSDVEASILDSAGEDLIESLLMASLRNITDMDAAANAASAIGAAAALSPQQASAAYGRTLTPSGGAAAATSSSSQSKRSGSMQSMARSTPSVSPSLLELANARDSAGRQLVHFVAGLGYTSLLSVLLAQLAADVNAQDHAGRTPLHYAVLASDEVEGGGNVPAAAASAAGFASSAAAGSPAALMVSALLSFGADDRLMDAEGRTALALADLHGRRHIVQVFMEVQNAESLEFDNVGSAVQQQPRTGSAAAHGHAHSASLDMGTSDGPGGSTAGRNDRAATAASPSVPASASSTSSSAFQRAGAREFLSPASSSDDEEDGGGEDEDDEDEGADGDEHMYAAGGSMADFAHAIMTAAGESNAAGAVDTSNHGALASAHAPGSSFPLDRAFSSLTLHDMGISQATLASFDAPLGAADLFSSSTAAFARVVRKVQRQIRWWLFRRHVAAQKLQSVARGMLARRGLKRLRESAQVIQSAFKARKVRRDFVQLRRATKFIQDKFRNARGGGAISPMSGGGGAGGAGGSQSHSGAGGGVGGGGSGGASASGTGPAGTPASTMVRPQLLRPISLSIGPGITSGGSSSSHNNHGGYSMDTLGVDSRSVAGGSASESESESKRSRHLQPPPALQPLPLSSSSPSSLLIHDAGHLSGDEGGAGRPLSALGSLHFRFSPASSMLLSSSTGAASSSSLSSSTGAAASASSSNNGMLSADALSLSLLLPEPPDADSIALSLSLATGAAAAGTEHTGTGGNMDEQAGSTFFATLDEQALSHMHEPLSHEHMRLTHTPRAQASGSAPHMMVQ